MRNVCQVDVLVGTKDRSYSPSDAAKRLFKDLPGCQVLAIATSGPRYMVTLLLPEMRGGYRDSSELKSFVELALTGKGVVVASAHSLREATPVEVLSRTLSRAR